VQLPIGDDRLGQQGTAVPVGMLSSFINLPSASAISQSAPPGCKTITWPGAPPLTHAKTLNGPFAGFVPTPEEKAELLRWGAGFDHNIDGVMEVVKLGTCPPGRASASFAV